MERYALLVVPEREDAVQAQPVEDGSLRVHFPKMKDSSGGHYLVSYMAGSGMTTWLPAGGTKR